MYVCMHYLCRPECRDDCSIEMNVSPGDEEVAESRGDEDSIDESVHTLQPHSSTCSQYRRIFYLQRVLLTCWGIKNSSHFPVAAEYRTLPTPMKTAPKK